MADLEKTLAFYSAALRGLAERQRVVSHNIANQNTPNYRAKTVAFERALAGALARGDGTGPIDFPVEEAQGLTVKSNGNNVDLEREWGLMEKNRLLHEIFARAAGGTLRKLVAAMRSQ